MNKYSNPVGCTMLFACIIIIIFLLLFMEQTIPSGIVHVYVLGIFRWHVCMPEGFLQLQFSCCWVSFPISINVIRVLHTFPMLLSIRHWKVLSYYHLITIIYIYIYLNFTILFELTI